MLEVAMTPPNPALQVRLRKGLAERNRLPLSTVLKILEECRLLINAFARRHSSDTEVDLQLEIVGSAPGEAFQSGSLQTIISAGAHPVIAAQAIGELVSHLTRIEANDVSFAHGDSEGAEILRHFYKIGLYQEKVQSELQLSVVGVNGNSPTAATLSAEAMATVRSLQTPNAEVKGIQVYGKLMELREIREDDDHGRGFQGDLLRDGGDRWRIRFREDQQSTATQLFRKRVVVFGDVKYFQTRSPLLAVQRIDLDEPKNYLAAFEKFVGSVPELRTHSLNDLVRAIQEEDE